MIKPLTAYEQKYVRWYIWEPLRRHADMRVSFDGLFLYDNGERIAYGLDPDAEDAFCKTWRVPRAIDPGTEFEKIPNPEWFFFDWYKPLFEDAAYLDHAYDPAHWIVQGSHIPILISTMLSQNMVLEALKKELDDWWPKWKSSCGGKRQHKAPPVQVGESVGLYQRVLVNLAAPRKAIEAEIKKLLVGTKRASTARLNFKKRKAAFELWDLVDLHHLRVEDAAKICRMPESTAYDLLNKLSRQIYNVSFLRSRSMRQLTPKKKAPELHIDRELEVELQKEYLRSNTVTACCPVIALVDEILAKSTLGNLKRDKSRYDKERHRLEDEIIRKIDRAADRWLQKYDSEKVTPVISELVRVEAKNTVYKKPAPVISELLGAENYFLLETSTNLDEGEP